MTPTPVVSREAQSPVLALDDPAAADPACAGAKAAAIARARAAGLPALTGFVITTEAVHDRAAAVAASRDRWRELSDDGRRALVVRSSSAIEDTAASSMAGRFTTVVGVTGWDAYVDAVDRVCESAEFVARTEGLPLSAVPIAVLVQPLLSPRVAGVLFGVDPVTGRSDRRVIAAVRGVPEQLVSGTESGSRYEVDARGRPRHVDLGPDRVRLHRRDLRRLVDLAARCAAVFGGPQDIEWAVDADGSVVLLQSRPVTTALTGTPAGPVYGPGPVSETFPDPLTQLEQDLWVDPLGRALGEVLDLVGRVPAGRIHDAPLLVTVDGRVAVDLDVFEVRHGGVSGRIRALRSAWRVGRLRLALLDLADAEIDAADAALAELPAPSTLSARQLVAGLERLRSALGSLHGHEMLVGMVLEPGSARSSGQSVALRVLSRAREEGVPEAEIPVRFPVVLALVPPAIGGDGRLPGEVAVPEWVAGPEDAASTAREALRLRVRWTQEATVRYARALGERLAVTGAIGSPEDVAHLRLEDLEAVVRGLSVALAPSAPPPSPPLPARFRLSDTGRPVELRPRHRSRAGTGAGGGSGAGPVRLDPDAVVDGDVLVVRTLDTRLAPVIPRLGGLVAETGSVLAHLAILAREAGLPTVVALPGATTRWPEGTLVRVDGLAGTVELVDDPRALAASTDGRDAR